MKIWLKALYPPTLVLLCALLVGAVFDAVQPLLTLSLFGYLLYHTRQLVYLKHWLLKPGTHTPVAPALWGDVFDDLHNLQEQGKARTRELDGLVKQFRDSAEAMPDGLVVLDAGLSIIWLNPAAERLLGLQHEKDLGQRVDNLVRYPEFVEYLQQKTFVEPLELQLRKTLDTVLSVRMIPYGAKQTLMLVQDITAMRNIDRMRHDFVANASHELRTPLTVIKGYLDALDTTNAPVAWQPALVSMQEQSERMENIIRDLLELLRLESAHHQSVIEPQPIAQMITAICKHAEELSAGRLVIETELDDTLLLLGSDAELHSVISNLVMNAVYYTPTAGTITVRWFREGQGVALTVRDSGVGMGSEHIHRITERFYRINNPQAVHEGGTGLGLAIVKHALQRHDATLEVSSKLGYGSLFHCRFPASRVVVREPLVAVAS